MLEKWPPVVCRLFVDTSTKIDCHGNGDFGMILALDTIRWRLRETDGRVV